MINIGKDEIRRHKSTTPIAYCKCIICSHGTFLSLLDCLNSCSYNYNFIVCEPFCWPKFLQFE